MGTIDVAAPLHLAFTWAAEELKALHREANALRELRERAGDPEFGKLVFTKVFTKDVQRLLSMEDMWKKRTPPAPLDYDAVMAESVPPPDPNSLRDQRMLSLRENADMFLASLAALAKRRVAGEEYIMFDKDDDDVMDFVAATANLRAHVFHIPEQTRFAAKSMAGNIIPAIATTNGTDRTVEGSRWAEAADIGAA